MTDKPAHIDRDYLFGERRSLLQRLGQIEDLLEIPRSVVPKSLRGKWKKFLEGQRGVDLTDAPKSDLDVTEGGPN